MADDYIEPPADDMSRISARLFDYSWDDINAFEQQPIDEAIASGYSQDEVDAFLGRGSLQDRLASDLAYRTTDPQFATGLRAPSESIPLTPMDELPSYRIGQFAGKDDYKPRVDPLAEYIEPPANPEDVEEHARASYANALLRGDVSSPRDFSERYAGAILAADPDADQGSLVRAAAVLGAGLPSDQDFTDQAIALARDSGIVIAGPEPTEGKVAAGNINLFDRPQVENPEGGTSTVFSMSFGTDKGEVLVPRVSDDGRILSEKEAIAQYEETGKSFGVFDTPDAATSYAKWLHAQQADLNGLNQIRTIKERLVDHWSETGEPLLEIYRQAQFDAEFKDSLTAAPPPGPTWLDKFGTGARDLYGGMRQLADNALPESFKRTVDEVNAEVYRLTGIEQMPLAGADAIERGRLAMLSEEGYDSSWWRWGGEAAAALPLFTTLGLSGAWAFVAAGATGAAAAAAFHPSTANDYWSSKAVEVAAGGALGAGLGGALYGVGKVISAMSPQAAAYLRNVLSHTEEPKLKVLNPGEEIASVEVRASEALAPIAPAERVVVAEGAAPVSPIPQFAEDAIPVAKMGALARDYQLGMKPPAENLAAGANRAANLGTQVREAADEFGPNFFRNLAAGQDAPTLALAEGMDAARGVVQVLADIGGRILRDDSGALTIFPNAAQRAARTAYRDARNFGQDLVVKGRVEDERQLANYRYQFDYYKSASGQLENLHKLVNKHMPEWRGELEKGPMGNPMSTPIGQAIDFIEGRSAGVILNPSNQLAPFADAVRGINQHLRLAMEDAEARGLHSMRSYYDDYFRHMWADPNAADKTFGIGRAGTSASFNARTLPTMADGLARGLKPAVENPLEMVMLDAAGKLRYLKTLDMLDTARNSTDSAGNKFAYWANQAKPGDVALKGVGTEKLVPALTNAGKAIPPLKMYANPGFANAWNVWHGMGINRGKTLYDNLLYAKNLSTAQQLLLPLFHTATMAIETLAGGMANALTEMGVGAARIATGRAFGHVDAAGVRHSGGIDEFGRGLLDMGMSATLFPKLVQQLVRGHKGLHGYNTLAADPVIDILTGAGARFGARQDIYMMGRAPVIWDSIRRGSLGEEYRAQLRHVLGDVNNTNAQRIAGSPLRALGFAGHELGRLTNTISGPLFDLAIPRLKAGVNMERLQTYIRQNPTATPEQLMQRARQITRNTDDRMGEMNMDNIFWPKAVKQITQMLMISPGWVYGFARFGAATVGLNLERMTLEQNRPAMQAMAGFAAAYSMQSMAYQYMKTGTFPWNTDTPIRDLVAPRTGGVDAKSGVPERSLLPSQAKEYMDYFKIGATTWHNPMHFLQSVDEYALGKVPGIWQIVRGLATGEDAIGHHIAETKGGWPGFIAKSLMPIFLGSLSDRKKGTGISEYETFVGIRPMTKSIQDPAGFFEGLDKLSAMHAKEEYRRAVNENKYLETPRELPDKPSGAGNRTSSGHADPDELAARQVTNQRRSRSRPDEYSDALLGPVFGAYGGVGRRSTRGSSSAPTSASGVTRLAGGTASRGSTTRRRTTSRRRRA